MYDPASRRSFLKTAAMGAAAMGFAQAPANAAEKPIETARSVDNPKRRRTNR